MKKLVSLLLILCMCLALALSLSSCAHKPFENWTYNEEVHYHGCARFGGCDDGCTYDEAAHEYGKWMPYTGTQHKATCDVCGYDRHWENHDFSVEITETATPSIDGEKTYTCGDCGFSYTHSYEYGD